MNTPETNLPPEAQTESAKADSVKRVVRRAEPANITYDIGATIYNQPLYLTWCKGSAGERQWVLRKEAADQRDDTCLISGITDDVIVKMFEAVADKQAQARRV